MPSSDPGDSAVIGSRFHRPLRRGRDGVHSRRSSVPSRRTSAVFVLVNLITDLLYAKADPQVRVE